MHTLHPASIPKLAPDDGCRASTAPFHPRGRGKMRYSCTFCFWRIEALFENGPNFLSVKDRTEPDKLLYAEREARNGSLRSATMCLESRSRYSNCEWLRSLCSQADLRLLHVKSYAGPPCYLPEEIHMSKAECVSQQPQLLRRPPCRLAPPVLS